MRAPAREETMAVRIVGSVWLLLPVLLGTACGGGVTTTGINGKEYFRLTEGIQWQYTNGVDSGMYEVWCQGEREINGEMLTVYAWKYGNSQELVEDESLGELFFMETYWSKQVEGVMFHGSGALGEVPSDDDDSAGPVPPPASGDAWRDLVYEYPLLFAAVDLSTGDIHESGSDGETWAAEYVENVRDFQTDGATANALHISFVDSEGVSPFGGEYYIGANIGIMRFQVAQEPEVEWTLKRYKES